MKVIVGTLIQAAIGSLMYLAFWRGSAGAMNILEGMTIFTFVLACLVLISPNTDPRESTGLARWLLTSLLVARVLVFLWFGCFWLAALSVAGVLFVESHYHNLDRAKA